MKPETTGVFTAKAVADIACIDARRAWIQIERDTIIRAAAAGRGAIFFVQLAAAFSAGFLVRGLLP